MKKIALIIGHSADKVGAINYDIFMGEFEFNNMLARKIEGNLIECGYSYITVYRDTYKSLPAKVNLTRADIALSLHCNAFNKGANGTEVLYYKGSTSGAYLAAKLQGRILKCLGLKDRGIKPIEAAHTGSAGDRGGYLLKGTIMPTVIVEPFFIDCTQSLNLALAKMDLLAKAYVDAIEDYFKEC